MAASLRRDLEQMGAAELGLWLQRALRDRVHLPYATPDEMPAIAVQRVYASLSPAAQQVVQETTSALIRYLAQAEGEDPAYCRQLLLFCPVLGSPAVTAALAELVDGFLTLPHLTFEVQMSLLAALVEASPRPPASLWMRLAQQKPSFASLAFSGALRADPVAAVQVLPLLPDDVAQGQATVMKLDIAYDILTAAGIWNSFEAALIAVLPQCASNVAGPIRPWLQERPTSPSA